MKLKHALIPMVLTIAFSGVFAANAADEKPVMGAGAEKAQPAKKDKRPDQAQQKTQGTAGKAEETCCRHPSQAGRTPSHDHHYKNQ